MVAVCQGVSILWIWCGHASDAVVVCVLWFPICGKVVAILEYPGVNGLILNMCAVIRLLVL